LTDEAVTAPRQRLDVARLLGRVAQSISQSLDRCVDAVIELYNGVVGPQPNADILPQNSFTRPFQKHLQDLKRLLLQSDSNSVLT